MKPAAPKTRAPFPSDLANDSPSRATSITIDDVLLTLFVGALAWTPFWLGSNRPIAWGINAVLFCALACAYEIVLAVRGRPHPLPIGRIRIAAGLFALAALWALLQNATWTPSAWQHPLWRLAADALDRKVAGSISIDRDLSHLALLRLLTAASAFWLALQLAGDERRARLLVWSVIVIGALYSAVGLFALGILGSGRVFTLPGVGPSKFVTSTFVSQNHFVTFAGIALIGAVGLTLRAYREAFGHTASLLRLKFAMLIETSGGKAALPLASAAVILPAQLLTANRGGIISTALGIVVLVSLTMRNARTRKRSEVLPALFALLLIGAVFVSFGDLFLGRIARDGIIDHGRGWVASLTIASILTRPLTGFGYGTFSAAFPMFRDGGMNLELFWDKAHNTYLEVFQGLGLLFGTMLIASVALLVWICIKGARSNRRGVTIPAIAAGASVLVGVHALVDFSLQIQAVTLTYMTILAAGVAQAVSSRQAPQT
ncbi:MAG TPA: O-antigen ligase family protein [Xanthobacteraceae bacterium]|jgi:branched-subunit amino acid transport protein AzlD